MPWTLVKLLGALLAGGLAILAAAWLFQRKLIYFPFDGGVPQAGEWLPGAANATLGTADGLRLAAWFVPAASRDPRATVLVFPGNAGNRSARAPLALALARRGFSVLLVDYRGYGGNPGSPSERGLYLDARAAHDFALARADVDPRSLIYFGESLGAAVALELALERPPAALVLRSPFTSLADVGALHYPLLPVRLLLRDRYPSIERIARLDCPVLVVALPGDDIVPASSSRALFEAAPAAARRFELVPGAGHNDRALLDGAAMLGAIEDFWCATRAEACEVRR